MGSAEQITNLAPYTRLYKRTSSSDPVLYNRFCKKTNFIIEPVLQEDQFYYRTGSTRRPVLLWNRFYKKTSFIAEPVAQEDQFYYRTGSKRRPVLLQNRLHKKTSFIIEPVLKEDQI